MTAWDIDDATARLARALASVRTGDGLRAALRTHLNAAFRAGQEAATLVRVRDQLLTPEDLDEMTPPPRGRLENPWRS